MMVTAVVPAYNEQQTIGSVVLGAKRFAKQVIVVDDGSHDDTAEIAKLAGAQVIHHRHNEGKGAALKTGFLAAEDADIVVTLDSDGQHHPHEIPQILEPIINHEADFVNGSRYMAHAGNNGYKDNNKTPFYRRVGQNVLDLATNINGNIKITDSQSGFRAFRGDAIDKFSFRSNGYSIESEMLIEAAHAGLKIKEVPIEVCYGEENHHKKNPITHGLGVLAKLFQKMEFNRPLFYFSLPGLLMMSIGLVVGLTYFGKYLAGVTIAIIPTAFAMLITFLGTVLAFTGFLLYALSRMMDNRDENNKKSFPKSKTSEVSVFTDENALSNSK